MADYDVVLLVEQALSGADALRVRSLHEGLDDPVTYHVLMPVEDAAARVEAALTALPTTEYAGTMALTRAPIDLDAVQADAKAEAQRQLDQTLAALHSAGATADGRLVDDPVHGLVDTVKEVDGREAIILTRPHLVAEFFHVDWTNRARHRLGVPVLHLLEHETFDEQAGEGEGISGF
jgi:hypothetical protein